MEMSVLKMSVLSTFLVSFNWGCFPIGVRSSL